jgi:hypothetical protein
MPTGISVEAWTLSRHRVSLHYDFNPGGRRLCSTSGYVGDVPYQIVVKD